MKKLHYKYFIDFINGETILEGFYFYLNAFKC